MLDLTPPLSSWLVAGGDQRQVLGQNGLTRYFTAPGPRPGVALGSCTASSPSPQAFRAGEVSLESWRHQRDPAQAVDAGASDIRTRLRRVFGCGQDPDIVLCPSGTDAIYMISALAMSGERHIHHIVVGAAELGGGTVTASRGLTFSPMTPFAGEIEVNTPVQGLSERCTAEPLYLRGEEGGCVDLAATDKELAERVHHNAELGHQVVVHMVLHSKTGLRAPSMATMVQLKEQYGEQLLVLVDAAQGRIGPPEVRRALDAGFAVLWTGSKFYSGPPFSGCLVLPPALSHDPGPLPAGLSMWFAKADLPFAWGRARASLKRTANPGLILRWVLAMEETEAYHQIDQTTRSRVYHTFVSGVIECFGPSPHIHVDLPQPPVHLLANGLGAYPSVLCFSVEGPTGRLTVDQLRTLYVLLDSDLSERDPRMGTRFNLGQPVALGPPNGARRGVLRVALGARLVVDLHRAPDGGAAWFRAKLTELRDKIEWLVQMGDCSELV